MIKLKLGKMTTKQVAAWMGMNYSTFRNNKSKYLMDLKEFCSYDETYGGVIVKQIYDQVYKKDIPKDNVVFLNQLKQTNDGLSSSAGMARKLRRDNQYYGGLSQRTVERRMGNMGKAMFGAYENGLKQAQGKFGRRKWVYAIKIDEYNKYRFLSQDQMKIFKQLVREIYGERNNTQNILKGLLLEEAFKYSDMSKEEYLAQRELFGLDLFPQILKRFREETGLIIVRIQEYKVNGLVSMAK